MQDNDDFILEVVNISKTFPGVKALSDISFNLRKGEVHAIVGENGAGKSTLIKILSGVYVPDEGSIIVDGVQQSKMTPSLASSLGIFTIFQENTLLAEMTVAENLFLGASEEDKRFINWKKVNTLAEENLKILDLNIKPSTYAKELGIAEQQGVQITKAISRNGRILIMDEPTASFGPDETRRLFATIRKLKERGEAVIFISHHLDEVLDISDRVTIIRDGVKINTHDTKNLTHETMVSEMVGRNIGLIFAKEKVEIGPESLRVDRINKDKVLHDISFSLHEGEILGVYGLVGAGRTEMVMALMGVLTTDAYDVSIYGEKIKVTKPKDAIDRGIGLITEDRRRTGLIVESTVKDNMLLPGLKKLSGLLLKKKEEDQVVTEYIDKLSIRTPNMHRLVKYLSGGNQQKVVLAKWMYADKEILLFDEPTRGVDIGAKEEIYKIIVSLAKQKKSILLISSEMPELIALSDRVLVMREGRFTGELQGDEITEEKILLCAIGRGIAS